ncbi:MAG: hypothetical protein M8866_07365 [marine benthic group bacterium]|nr:hypothetical protein [Candidatus Benthicola marisminoris]
MRHILPVVAGMLILVAWPTDAIAQRRAPQDMEARHDSIMGVYSTRLNLSDEQAVAIREILDTQVGKARGMMQSARGQGQDAMMEMRDKVQDLQKETSEQVEELLSEEQIPEYRQIQAELEEQRRNRMRQRQSRN